MPRWWMAVAALALAACANDPDPASCGLTVCTDGTQCCVGCEGNQYCAITCPSRDACPDAGAETPDAGEAPVDAGGPGGDAGGPTEDAGDPMVDAGDPGGDAGVDAGAPDAGPLCEAEVCDGEDDDCDTRVDEGAACPCPVVQGAAGTAYLFCDEDRSWAAARMVCEGTGYSLAVVEDATEDALIYGELAARGFADAWIGLNDILTEMTWVWLDGVPAAYTHWDDGEPNDGSSGGEDCGVIMTREGRESEWDDRPCDSERPYVCETPAP